MAYIEFDHVVKEYPSGSSVIRALDEASFTADQGELSVILGQSGAGKTTALNILGGRDTATSGRGVWLAVFLLFLPCSVSPVQPVRMWRPACSTISR